jgi:hypothetical protein
VSKRSNGRYEPDRRTWLKIKCLNREELVVVGWSDPEGSRHHIGSLLLGYYTEDRKLIYAGRAGTGMPVSELERLWRRLQPLVVDKMPLAVPPPRGTRFGSPLVLSRVHGCGLKWSSKSAMSNGPRTVCSGMSSIWASAKIRWPRRCAVIHPTLARLDRKKLARPIFVQDIGPRKSSAHGTLLNLSPRRLLSALAGLRARRQAPHEGDVDQRRARGGRRWREPRNAIAANCG